MHNRRLSGWPNLVARVRAFNRFYTRQIGLLNEGLYGSRFSLTEVRVLFEIWRRNETTATVVLNELGLDAGYLSRMLQRFERAWLIHRRRSKADGRQIHLSLTAQGRRAFLPLEARADAEVAHMLGKLTALKRRRLVQAMSAVREILSGPEHR
jgi:DNA-binding MarR family transcriptional regulator